MDKWLTRAREYQIYGVDVKRPSPEGMREVNGIDPVLNCKTKRICAPHRSGTSVESHRERFL